MPTESLGTPSEKAETRLFAGPLREEIISYEGQEAAERGREALGSPMREAPQENMAPASSLPHGQAVTGSIHSLDASPGSIWWSLGHLCWLSAHPRFSQKGRRTSPGTTWPCFLVTMSDGNVASLVPPHPRETWTPSGCVLLPLHDSCLLAPSFSQFPFCCSLLLAATLPCASGSGRASEKQV